MAFPSYSVVWRNIQSGHFDAAAQSAMAKAALSQKENQPYCYVTDAFANYVRGYRDHQFTYHYSKIKGQLIEPQLERLRENNAPPARVVQHLLEFLKAELDTNNANDCVDLAGWKEAADQAANVVQDGLRAVNEEIHSPTWPGSEYHDFLTHLQMWFESSSIFYKAVCAYARYVTSINGIEWHDSEASRCQLFNCLERAAKELEEKYGDQDSASEIRAHLRFSKRIAEVTAGQKHLYLEGAEVSWLFPFKFPSRDVEKLFAKLEESDFIDADSLQIYRGPLVDIIDTSYGKQGFKHALILSNRPQRLELKVSNLSLSCEYALQIYENEIAVLRIWTRVPGRIDVIRARLLFGLSYPFLSGEYKVFLEDDVSDHIHNVREAASANVDRIYLELSKAVWAGGECGSERDGQQKHAPLHELDWFSYLVVDRIVLGEVTVLSFAEIQAHPELKALYFPVREARASYYDWAACEDQPVENLAQNRFHSSDIFFMNGNQAFIYLRDDPFWAVLEYRHTLDQTFMLKSWVISLHQKVDEALNRTHEVRVSAHEPTRKLSRQIEHLQNVLKDIAAVRRDAVSILNLISNSSVSLYPDYATVLRRMHAVRELPELLELLERKVRNLGESESSLLNMLRPLEERRRAAMERIVRNALAMIGVLTILTTGLQFLQLKTGGTFDKFRGLWSFWERNMTIAPGILRDISLGIVQAVIVLIAFLFLWGLFVPLWKRWRR